MENLLAGETVPGLDSEPPTRFPYGSQTASVPQGSGYGLGLPAGAALT